MSSDGEVVQVGFSSSPGQAPQRINPARADAQTDGTQKSQIVDGDGDVAEVDDYTKALEIIDSVHEHIHAGEDFYYDDNITLANGASQDYLLTTGIKHAHLVFDFDFLFVTQIQIFEASDKTGTTPQTIVNRNRNSATTPLNTVHKGTSGGTTDGTRIRNYKAGLSTGSGANKIQSGGGMSGRFETILKPSTKYIFRITSSTDANIINALLDWYEI